MRYLKFIIFSGIVLGVIVQNSQSQNTHRQHETSVHSASVVDPVTTPKDSTRKFFGDKFVFEFLGGPSMCFFTRTGGDAPDQVMFHRYTLALAVVHRTTKKLNLEAKILWEAKGILLKYQGSEDNNLEDLLYKQGIKLDYLTLALAVDHYIDCERRLYVGAGASVGMLIQQSTFTYTYDDDGKKVSSYTSETFGFRKFELGLVANLGYRKHVWKNLLVNVQVLGNFGITRATEKFDPDTLPPNRNANIALLIGIGIGH